MNDPHQLAQQAGLLDERQWHVFLDDLAQVRSQHNQSQSVNLPKSPSRDQVAEWLAIQHYAADPGITDVWYLRDSPKQEIRLIEVNTLLTGLSDEDIIPVDFGFDVEGLNYTLLVVDVTPDQWKRLQAGALPLPEHWTLNDSRHFGYAQQ